MRVYLHQHYHHDREMGGFLTTEYRESRQQADGFAFTCKQATLDDLLNRGDYCFSVDDLNEGDVVELQDGTYRYMQGDFVKIMEPKK